MKKRAALLLVHTSLILASYSCTKRADSITTGAGIRTEYAPLSTRTSADEPVTVNEADNDRDKLPGADSLHLKKDNNTGSLPERPGE